jgi:hypothetical protein
MVVPTIDPVRRVVYETTGDSYSDPAADTSDAFVAVSRKLAIALWRFLEQGLVPQGAMIASRQRH